jgi:hypothetical protein
MKLTFTRLLLFTVLAALLTSCGGSDDDATPETKEFYMKFKANGTQMIYDQQAIAVFNFDSNNNSYHCQTYANKTTELTRDAIDLMIVDVKPLATGVTYSLKSSVNLKVFGPTPQAKAVYWDAAGTGFTAQLPDSTDELLVTFSENTGDHVKGTFSGRVFTSVGRNEVTITEGEFNLSKR